MDTRTIERLCEKVSDKLDSVIVEVKEISREPGLLGSRLALIESKLENTQGGVGTIQEAIKLLNN